MSGRELRDFATAMNVVGLLIGAATAWFVDAHGESVAVLVAFYAVAAVIRVGLFVRSVRSA